MRTRSQLNPPQEGAGSDRESSADESEQASTLVSDDDAASVRAPPRKRRATGRKSDALKVVQKKRGRLAGFLKLPFDVFHMIASYLLSGDILTLSRSNHFFRNILMQRSAVSIWKAAERNVEGLPPCLPGLCEPQYAALVFSRSCSSCGGSLSRGMDPYLLVRLCNSCRDEKVVATEDIEENLRVLVHTSTYTQLKPSRYAQVTCLRADADFVRQELSSFKIKGKTVSKKCEKWIELRKQECKIRAQHSHKLQEYLDESVDNRMKEIDILKAQRRNDLIEKLKNAGWAQQDYKFPHRIARKWALLVEAQKPMTERVWQNLYPKLLPLLERNRARQEQLGWNIRHRDRKRKLRALLREIRSSQVLLELEHDVLPRANYMIPQPDPEGANEQDEVLEAQPLAVVSTSTLRAAFPSNGQAYQLPVLCDILNADTDVDEFVAAFEESRPEIMDAIQTWRSQAEEELVNILAGDPSHSSGSDSEDDSHSEENAEDEDGSLSDDPTMGTRTSTPDATGPEEPMSLVSSNTRTLLRADSAFCIRDTQDSSPIPIFYPELLSILEDKAVDEFYIKAQFSFYRPPDFLWEASDVEAYPEATLVAKSILAEIEKPDATAFELSVLGKRFMCGRCRERRPREWNEMIQHFVEARAHCRAADTCKLPEKKTTVYNEHHTLDPIHLSKGKKKPLVILMNLDEAKAAASKYTSRLFVSCNPCADLGIDFGCAKDGMLRHVKDVHDVKDPKAAHYTRSYEKGLLYAHPLPDSADESDSGPEYPEGSFESHLERDKSAAWWIDYSEQRMAMKYRVLDSWSD